MRTIIITQLLIISATFLSAQNDFQFLFSDLSGSSINSIGTNKSGAYHSSQIAEGDKLSRIELRSRIKSIKIPREATVNSSIYEGDPVRTSTSKSLRLSRDSGPDPMVAVGDNFMVVSQTDWIAFYDKDGYPLIPQNPVIQTTDFFSAFLQKSLNDGSPNPNDVNAYFDIPENISECCTSNPDPEFRIDRAYDTRVLYSERYDRFIILAALRNQVYKKSLFGSDECSISDSELDVCEQGAIRLVAFAISKTEDPRDGFYQYVKLENNYRDFPQVAVDRVMLVFAHGDPHGNKMGSSSASFVSLRDLKSGEPAPRSFSIPYLPASEGNPVRVIPCTNQLGPERFFFFIRPVGDEVRFYYLDYRPEGAGMNWVWDNSPNQLTFFGSINTGSKFDVAPRYARLRYWLDSNKPPYIYFTGMKRAETLNDQPRYQTHFFRIPLNRKNLPFGSQWGVVSNSELIHHIWELREPEDNSDDIISYEIPSVDINFKGDMCVSYSRVGVNVELPQEVRYNIIPHENGAISKSTVLQEGVETVLLNGVGDSYVDQADDDDVFLDYSWVCADPDNINRFWIAHAYAFRNLQDPASTPYLRMVVKMVSFSGN